MIKMGRAQGNTLLGSYRRRWILTILKKLSLKIWTAFIWLRPGTKGGFL
jgi:hypothetical protein